MNRILILVTLCVLAGPLTRHCIGQTPHGSRPFPIRGVLPWHNFLSGPSAWNREDYEKYLDDCKEKQINFIGFHCYTGGGQRYVTYVEPMIRIEYKNILPDAFLDNSLTARWGYEPRAIKDFAFNTSKLFSGKEAAFGSDCSILSANKVEHYSCTQELMKEVMRMAHVRAMQTAMGFEFGVHPPEFFSLMEDGLYWEGTGSMIPNPTHYQAVEILYATIDNIVETYPDVDWIWLWLNEHSFFGFDADVALQNPRFKSLYERQSHLFEGAEMSVSQKLIGVWSLEYIRLAYEHIRKAAPGKGVLIGGWGGSNQLPAILRGLDKGLPPDIVFSCLNPGLGQYPQPDFIAEIAAHRRFWSIPWLEGDHQLWHYQPRVNVIREQVKSARKMNLDGVVAIHWRTEETKANLEAFSSFALNPDDSASASEVYRAFLRKECGARAADELAPLFSKFDEEIWLSGTSSPEFYGYTPGWGRLDSVSREKLRGLIAALEKAGRTASGKRSKESLAWFRANFEFTLLLDEVGRKLEPAYVLRKQHYDKDSGLDQKDIASALVAARRSLDEAPLDKLFTVYASRVRSRGELGVLSSMNQKLFNEYKDLQHFLSKAST
ncbi:hypothetical protein EHM92_08115, partial [bacterium]